MKNYKAKDVDNFISSMPIEAQPKLEEIRKVVKSNFPKAEEKISWGVPFYWQNGALTGFSPCKSYVLFGLVTRLKDKDRKMFEEKGYKTGKKTVQIRFDQKVPEKEIKQLLKTQAKMNEALRVARDKRKSKAN